MGKKAELKDNVIQRVVDVPAAPSPVAVVLPPEDYKHIIQVFVDGRRVMEAEEDTLFQPYAAFKAGRTVPIGMTLVVADLATARAMMRARDDGESASMVDTRMLLLRPLVVREYVDPLCKLLVVEASIELQEVQVMTLTPDAHPGAFDPREGNPDPRLTRSFYEESGMGAERERKRRSQ